MHGTNTFHSHPFASSLLVSLVLCSIPYHLEAHRETLPHWETASFGYLGQKAASGFPASQSHFSIYSSAVFGARICSLRIFTTAYRLARLVLTLSDFLQADTVSSHL